MNPAFTQTQTVRQINQTSQTLVTEIVRRAVGKNKMFPLWSKLKQPYFGHDTKS